MKQSLDWPGRYEPAITNILQRVPQIKKLLQGYTLKQAYIFGGFLRYIVERVSSGKRPSLDDFIEYGGDIDIFITPEQSEYPKLERNFDTIISEGCIIEYVGAKYDSDELTFLDFDVSKWKNRKNGRLPHGNYMIWIPFDGKNHVMKETETDTKETQVKEKISYAEIAKLPKQEPVEKEPDEIFQCKKWFKIDVIYGGTPSMNDFTANQLFWPCKPGQDQKRTIKDIIDRRIVLADPRYRCAKMLYRLIKLYRRGYKLSFDMYDPEFISQYLNMNETAYGFTCDMSSPSLKSGNRMQICTTKHSMTLIDEKYIHSLPEYSELTSLIKMPVSLLSPSNEVSKTPTPLRVYKSAYLRTKNKEYICVIALDIEKETRYVSNFMMKGFRFEKAIVGDIYGYPNVSIIGKIHQDFKVFSIYDDDYLYYDSKFPETKLVHAKSNKGHNVALERVHAYGIYAYTSIMDAWEHLGFSEFVYAEDFN